MEAPRYGRGRYGKVGKRPVRTQASRTVSKDVEMPELTFYCPLLRLRAMKPPCDMLKARRLEGDPEDPLVQPLECRGCDGHPKEYFVSVPRFQGGPYYSISDLKWAVIAALSGYGSAKEVRKIRESLDLEFEEAAAAIGMSKKALERLENTGHASVSLANLMGIPDGYKVIVTKNPEEPFRYVPVTIKHRGQDTNAASKCQI